jgi:hypothetical protein
VRAHNEYARVGVQNFAMCVRDECVWKSKGERENGRKWKANKGNKFEAKIEKLSLLGARRVKLSGAETRSHIRLQSIMGVAVN